MLPAWVEETGPGELGEPEARAACVKSRFVQRPVASPSADLAVIYAIGLSLDLWGEKVVVWNGTKGDYNLVPTGAGA